MSAVGQKLMLSAALWIPLGWGKVKGVQSRTPNCTGAGVPLGRGGGSLTASYWGCGTMAAPSCRFVRRTSALLNISSQFVISAVPTTSADLQVIMELILQLSFNESMEDILKEATAVEVWNMWYNLVD